MKLMRYADNIRRVASAASRIVIRSPLQTGRVTHGVINHAVLNIISRQQVIHTVCVLIICMLSQSGFKIHNSFIHVTLRNIVALHHQEEHIMKRA